MIKFMRDTRLMLGRSIRRTLRNPTWVLIGLFQPVLYLLFFAPLLEGLHIPGISRSGSLNLFVPGLLVMLAMFGAAFSGFGILEDLHGGVIERLRVTPASRLALLLGITLHDVLVFMLQCGIVVVAAAIIGLKVDIAGLLILFGLVALMGLMMVSVSYAIALLIKDNGGLAAVLNSVTQPLLLLSGVLLPLTLAPRLMQTLAQFNPFAYMVDAARALVDGRLGDASILPAFGIVSVLAALATTWAVRVFRRAMA